MDKKSKLINLLLVVGIVAVSIFFYMGANDVFALQYLNYSSEKYQIQFQYPSTWTVHEKTNRFETGSDIKISSGFTPSGSIGIGYADDLNRGYGSSDLQTAVIEFFKGMTSDYSKEQRTIEAPSFISIDGYRAGTFLFTSKDKYETNSPEIAMQIWMIFVGSHGYDINFLATTDNYDSPENIEIRDHFIKSIKFTGQGNNTNTVNSTSRFT